MWNPYENFHVLHFQKRIVFAETIRVNTVNSIPSLGIPIMIILYMHLTEIISLIFQLFGPQKTLLSPDLEDSNYSNPDEDVMEERYALKKTYLVDI